MDSKFVIGIIVLEEKKSDWEIRRVLCVCEVLVLRIKTELGSRGRYGGMLQLRKELICLGCW